MIEVNDAIARTRRDLTLGSVLKAFLLGAAMFCLATRRADLVLTGCAILDAIRNAFPMPRLRVADRGLREGMLVEMMREDGVLKAC